MSEYLFIQRYSEDQNPDQMEGTKEYPYYLAGKVKEAGERFVVITIPYDKDAEVHVPPFRHLHKWLHLRERLANLHYGDVYVQGVMVDWEDEQLTGDEFSYKVIW